jgi:hypothetical protein
MNKFEMENFIGVFPNAVSKEYCDAVIQHYKYLENWNRVVSRQDHDKALDIHKKTDQYFFENEKEPTLIDNNAVIAREFGQAAWSCYGAYAQKYGALTAMSPHKISETIKLQKTVPTGGYHIWHCEHDNSQTGRRLLLVMLYLNTVESGGETEFLYQSKRVSPEAGTIVICPSGFTHTHRGNPPLSEDKYLMNTWIEFV